MEDLWTIRLFHGETHYEHAQMPVTSPSEGLLYVKIVNMLFDVAREGDICHDTVVNRYQFANKAGVTRMLNHFHNCEIYLYYAEKCIASIHPDIIEWDFG